MNMKKYEIATKIERIFASVGTITDTRIYYGNKCWNYDSSGRKSVLTDIKASEYIGYANDATITCSFEGSVHSHLNHYIGNGELGDKLTTMLEEYGYWYELGNGWNFALYE
tara:strand:+ start:401 stop:733 length:333 start_codon:yes stop_codon:yes gene_type:complete